MKHRSIPFLTIFVLIILTSCPFETTPQDNSKLTVSVWNVQNIFNALQDGHEYSDYLPRSGWTEQAYQNRLRTLSSVVSLEALSSSDVFVFNEVENDSVVRDILNLSFFKNSGFLYYATAGETNGAIKISVVSKIPITGVKVHNVANARPVLQVELQNLEERFIILAVHAKSKKEGSQETSALRLALAKTISKIVNDIELESPNALVLVCGDFNESYTDNNMMCDARSSQTKCPLLLLPDFKNGYFYCPWLDPSFKATVPGSYYYNGEWECIDNILISSEGKDGQGWEYDSGGVVFQGILQTTDNKPNAYKRDLLTGVSDHLPIWVSFTKN